MALGPLSSIRRRLRHPAFDPIQEGFPIPRAHNHPPFAGKLEHDTLAGHDAFHHFSEEPFVPSI